MSEIKYHAYTDEEMLFVIEHIGTQTANSKCPFCGNPTWTAETEKRDGEESLIPYPAFIMFGTPPYTRPFGLIPVVVLTCDNCGFIRHHSITSILKLRGASA
jgi:predicted RNA-binding Zn-ribbon protein involved in translation (DUF1610 family)